MDRIVFVVGTRPNFMKVAPLLDALKLEKGIQPYLVHTGQHYDERLSKQFFDELSLPEPDVNLAVGSAPHGAMTGEIMKRLEPVLMAQAPCWVVVVGDVNSTMAAVLVAVKLHLKVAHVEAGLRSFDRRMPEEVNRVVTDVLSDLLFVSEPAGVENLRLEGIPEERIFLVGDVMVDSVRRMLPRALQAAAPRLASFKGQSFGLATFHRPVNVDDPAQLAGLMDALETVSRRLPLIFPVHPRTEARLKAANLYPRGETSSSFLLAPPLGYLEFLGLLSRAALVVTDSGGIQSEAAYLGTPCLTLRDTTERPETVRLGANRLLGTEPSTLAPAVDEVLSRAGKTISRSDWMDGHAAERIVAILLERLPG